MNRAVRVVIADDHLIVRKGLRMMLEETREGFEVVGDAADGATAVQLVHELHPDVVLMDVRMPEMDGIQAIEHIRNTYPEIAVLILTTYNEDDLIIRGMQAGACGYLLKDTPLDVLLTSIDAAAQGKMLLQPEIMARILARTTPFPSNPRGKVGLTERECEVLSAVARGERNKEIAARLGITERTVKAYLTSIYTKLNVDSRTSAVTVAIERGILQK